MEFDILYVHIANDRDRLATLYHGTGRLTFGISLKKKQKRDDSTAQQCITTEYEL